MDDYRLKFMVEIAAIALTFFVALFFPAWLFITLVSS